MPSRDPGLLTADSSEPYYHYCCRFAGQEALRMAKAITSQRAGIAFGAYPRDQKQPGFRSHVGG